MIKKLKMLQSWLDAGIAKLCLLFFSFSPTLPEVNFCPSVLYIPADLPKQPFVYFFPFVAFLEDNDTHLICLIQKYFSFTCGGNCLGWILCQC